MCLGPNGSFAAINDSGAQICVCGPEDEHRLVELTPAPADMRVFGAAGTRLQLKSLGYMILLFPSSPVPDNGAHRLAVNHVVLRGYSIQHSDDRCTRIGRRSCGPRSLSCHAPARRSRLW